MENLSLIKSGLIKKRMKREIEDLVLSNICTLDDVTIELDNNDNYACIVKIKKPYYFELYVQKNYPFSPPKTNNYSHHNCFSENFRNKLKKICGVSCFCCESVLCPNNWTASCTIKHILNEYNMFKNACKEIIHRIIINVIKRKYLNDNINIIEWLY